MQKEVEVMTTQSTGSLRGRIVGVLIVLIALPILTLAPAFLADRFTMQSPSEGTHASVQPSISDAAIEQIHEDVATIDERPIHLDQGFAVSVEDSDLVREADSITITSDDWGFDDSEREVVFLDTKSEDGCVLTVRVYSDNDHEDILTGRIRIDDDEIRSPNRDCGILFETDWKAQ